jgi:hypothetical protein
MNHGELLNQGEPWVGSEINVLKSGASCQNADLLRRATIHLHCV